MNIILKVNNEEVEMLSNNITRDLAQADKDSIIKSLRFNNNSVCNVLGLEDQADNFKTAIIQLITMIPDNNIETMDKTKPLTINISGQDIRVITIELTVLKLVDRLNKQDSSKIYQLAPETIKFQYLYNTMGVIKMNKIKNESEIKKTVMEKLEYTESEINKLWDQLGAYGKELVYNTVTNSNLKLTY